MPWVLPSRTISLNCAAGLAVLSPPPKSKSSSARSFLNFCKPWTSRKIADPPPAVSPPPETAVTIPAMSANAVEVLRDRRLEVPVQGARREDLRNMFDERRGTSRRHEAIDLLAPRNSPVVAVEDGTIARLFNSDPGGITVYQFDPTSTYCYYYAHLDRYAEGIRDGVSVRRGQVIGYVGSTGNASPNAPHLHFAIFRLTPERLWWKGDPINPYPVLR